MKKIFYILLLIIPFCFFWNTGRSIENRTEAEDVYEYALMVEEGRSHPWYYHKHHLAFGPMMKAAFDAAEIVGYKGRAIEVMLFISAVSASATLLVFFLFCYRCYGLRFVPSLITTLFLGSTYGFFRYSVESEIPIIAAVPMMASLFFASSYADEKRIFSVLTVVFSVAAVLLHIMNAAAVFVAIPFIYVLRKRWREAVLHITLTMIVVLGAYFTVAQFGTLYGGGNEHVSMIRFSSLIKGMVAFCQCIVSFDFLMGFSSVRAALVDLLPGRMLLEEFYFGIHLPHAHVVVSFVTLLGFGLLLGAGVLRAGWIWKKKSGDRVRYQWPSGIQVQVLLMSCMHFLCYAGLLLLVEPGNPELWVMGLVPFSLLFGGGVILPLSVDNRLWLPFVMIVMLFVHNSGAVRMLKYPEMDYQQQKAQAVFDFAGKDDVVITAGNPVFERYLRYHYAGTVAYLYQFSAQELLSGHIPETAGHVYILGDVFSQPSSLRGRFPSKTKEIDSYADRIIPNAELVRMNEFGGLYRFQK
jgi:hypothetical protein